MPNTAQNKYQKKLGHESGDRIILRPSGANDAKDLRDTYGRYFQDMPADTDELREECFHLRYQVYCLENTYEPVSKNPDERETDIHDRQSVHSLLYHRSTGAVVGTTRLILPSWEGNSLPLPIRTLCSPEVIAEFVGEVPVSQAAEISRFAISKAFRRRQEDRDSIVGGLMSMGNPDPRRNIQHISLGLMRSVLAMAVGHGLTHVFAVMEPSLLRMLRHLGIRFQHLGPLVDYHGRRQPCFCVIADLLDDVEIRNQEVWDVLTDAGRLWQRRADRN